MASPLELWQKLPSGFLKKGYAGWCQLGIDVQWLIVNLAEKQNFKCALCDATNRLEIEHDPDPEFGLGDQYTIYNIRGLACRGCNWKIMMFEKEERGEDTGWENFYSKLDDGRYWRYINAFDERAYPLVQAALKEKLGVLNYWRRTNLLYKFDRWKEGWGDWSQWCFEEIKDRRHGKIRTPAQFMKTLEALMKFIVDKVREDPSFRHSPDFDRLMAQLKPIIDKLRPIFESATAANPKPARPLNP